MLSKKLCSQLLDGTLTDHKNHISGVCRGFSVTVNQTQNGMFSFRIAAHSENDPGNAALASFVESRKAVTPQIQSVTASDNCITIVSGRTALIKKVPAHLNQAILPVLDYLAAGGYTSGCMSCGTQEAPVERYEINGTHHYLCSACAGKVESQLFQKKEAVLAKKSKLVPGIVGALLGSVIGCIVYVLIWQLGYVAAVAGLITAVCVFKGYEMLGGVMDKKGVVACVLVILFAVFLANQLAWAYDAYSALKEYYEITFFDCFRSLNSIITELELTTEYYGYLALAYVMTVLGSYGSIAAAFKSSSGSYTVKKMAD